MPPKTEWPCDVDGCSFVGKSHQSLAYHKRTAHPAPVDVEPKADAKPDTKADAKPDAKKEKREREDEDDGEPELSDGDIPLIMILPVIIVVLLVAGALLFRDKLADFFRPRPPYPPMANGVPS
jgi:hypothetical protein